MKKNNCPEIFVEYNTNNGGGLMGLLLVTQNLIFLDNLYIYICILLNIFLCIKKIDFLTIRNK